MQFGIQRIIDFQRIQTRDFLLFQASFTLKSHGDNLVGSFDWVLIISRDSCENNSLRRLATESRASPCRDGSSRNPVTPSLLRPSASLHSYEYKFPGLPCLLVRWSYFFPFIPVCRRTGRPVSFT